MLHRACGVALESSQEMPLSFTLLSPATEGVREAIRARLAHFNQRHVPDAASSEILIALRDASDAIVGGLCAQLSDQWMRVDLLVVPEHAQGQGWGSQMLRCAEAEAVMRGCHSSWLGTFEFQARGFYENLGYACFADLHDHPHGHTLHLMRKRLPQAQS